MNINLSITADQIDVARKPEIGLESEVYFSPENCSLLGTVRTTGAAAGGYISAGGTQIPTGGRDCFLRVASMTAFGGAGAMALTFDVIMDDATVDTAVATFHVPTYKGSGALNQFPVGLSAQLVPVLSPNKKIKTISGLKTTANMHATKVSKFELFTSPDESSFVYIDGATSKGGKFNLPSIVQIADGRNPSKYNKLGRGESNMVSIGFKDRGALEQLNFFNGSQGTIRFDIIKEDTTLSQRQLYSGYFVRAQSERGEGDDEVVATSEGPYEHFAVGYARVA